MSGPIKPEHGQKALATKARILAAARQCFAEIGYANTGIRDVAAAAGVSYALLGRYYGSKSGLLEAALGETLTPGSILGVDRAKFGENLANLLHTVSRTGGSTTSMTVLAAGDPEARAIATRLFQTQIVGPLSEWLGPPAARDRAIAVAMLCAGYVTHARLVPLLGEQDLSEANAPMPRWLAHALQNIVDQPETFTSPADKSACDTARRA